jgi:hypothetical protein
MNIAHWLNALDFALGQPKEIALIGDGGAQKLLESLLRAR